MNAFRNRRIRKMTLPASTAWLPTDIPKAKEKQERYTRQPTQFLTGILQEHGCGDVLKIMPPYLPRLGGH